MYIEFWPRYAISCIYIYIHILYACIHVRYIIYTHIFVLLLCLRFRRWFFLLVFAIAVCRTVWLGGAAIAVWKAVCLKGLWALWANERVQVDSGAMYRQRQGVCWGSFFFRMVGHLDEKTPGFWVSSHPFGVYSTYIDWLVVGVATLMLLPSFINLEKSIPLT